MTGGVEPLKSDQLGRVRTPVAKREEILDAFERSGVSGAEFARLTGIKCRPPNTTGAQTSPINSSHAHFRAD